MLPGMIGGREWKYGSHGRRPGLREWMDLDCLMPDRIVQLTRQIQDLDETHADDNHIVEDHLEFTY